MKRLIILVWLLLTISGLTGCLTSQTLPPKPVRPTLEIEQRSDGGICLDKENTFKLLDYIWQLEEGYE